MTLNLTRSKQSIRPRTSLTFLILFILFIGLRALLLLTSIETVSDREELFCGTVAKEILIGLKAPLTDYQPDPYTGGCLVVGALAAPFFHGLGPHLIALKIVPLLFSVFTFCLAILFLKTFFGPKSALTGGILLLLMPPSLTQLSLLAMGSHTESIALQVLMLFTFYTFIYQKDSKLLLAAFGLLSGFTFFFANISFLTFLSCLISWPLMPKRPFRFFNVLILSISTLVGLTPWFAYNLSHQLGGFHFLNSFFLQTPGSLLVSETGRHIPALFLRRLLELLLKGIPHSMGFRNIFWIPRQIFAAFYSFTYGFAAVLYLRFVWQTKWRHENLAKSLPLVLYAILFLLAYVWGFERVPGEASFFNYRYFAPFHFFILLWIASSFGPILKSSWLLAPLIFAGLIANTSMLFREPFARGFLYKGYAYDLLGTVWGEMSLASYKTLQELETAVKPLPDEDKRLFGMGTAHSDKFIKAMSSTDMISGSTQLFPFSKNPRIAETLGYYLPCEEHPQSELLNHWLEKIPAESKEDFFRGYFSNMSCLEARAPYLDNLPPEQSQWFYFYLGSASYWQTDPPFSDSINQMVSRMTPDETHWFYRGLGAMQANPAAAFDESETKKFFNQLSQIPELNREDYLWGLGWTIQSYNPGDSIRAVNSLDRFDSQIKSSAVKGLLAWEKTMLNKSDANG